MAAKITFTQNEEAALQLAVKYLSDDKAKGYLNKLIDKMAAARTKETNAFHGASVKYVLEYAKTKLGERFKTPDTITQQWIIKMQKAINDSGVTEATAAKAIDNCTWVGDVFAQTLIYKLAELAVMKPSKQGSLFSKKPIGPAAPSKKSGWLGKLDEE
jgi:hypothetical protein